ncbi:queuine tRNA-ribosyltransferase [Legionella israelensis]|uniref:queuine tRNA-ribosyltransferase n=1 Tax=Legionella israelensis TaxID=454 RepID=UPI00117E62C5|nr:queuine tRNA-ribosyltransferase [Legionella israelensis]QDP72300.1 queuine tRNA-ribosyltransferase [Legionella israelensis]
MSNQKYGFVPPIDTRAGACLTAANWQEAGLSALSCSLESLLFKPGVSVLKQMTQLSDFMGWSQMFVVKLLTMPLNEETYTLRSPYDGSGLHIGLKECIQLVNHLAPDYLVLPEGMERLNWVMEELLAESVFPLIAAGDFDAIETRRSFGIYYTPEMHPPALIKMDRRYHDPLPFAWLGDIEPGKIKRLIEQGALFVESDRPLSDAYKGLVYTTKGQIDLTESGVAEQYELIDSKCTCPTTCEQQFSRAYLHHLLQHTPLLCHRLLIQHNSYFIQQAMTSQS